MYFIKLNRTLSKSHKPLSILGTFFEHAHLLYIHTVIQLGLQSHNSLLLCSTAAVPTWPLHVEQAARPQLNENQKLISDTVDHEIPLDRDGWDFLELCWTGWNHINKILKIWIWAKKKFLQVSFSGLLHSTSSWSPMIMEYYDIPYHYYADDSEIIAFGHKEDSQVSVHLESMTLKTTNQATNLGVVKDSDLNFNSHIETITKSADYRLKNIAIIRGFMVFWSS